MATLTLKDPAHPYHRAPRGVWFIAYGHRIDRPYPCLCVLGERCKPYVPGGGAPCHCAGRTDPEAMPAHCCARRAAETTRRAEAA